MARRTLTTRPAQGRRLPACRERRAARTARGQRIRFSDAQRRKLARAAKALVRSQLANLDTLVTPDTLLRSYRRLVANKCDGSAARAPAVRRRTADIVELVVRIARSGTLRRSRRPRRPSRCPRSADPVSTITRSRCPQSPDPRVHDRAIRASTFRPYATNRVLGLAIGNHDAACAASRWPCCRRW